MEEVFDDSSGATWRDYILADGHFVAMRSAGGVAPPLWGSVNWGSFAWTAGTMPPSSVLYFTLDNLGSISVVTNASGTVVERDSYDAWGKRRNADGTAANCGTITSATTRGFTGQEMMDGLCTINFNARIYDPTLGRFLTADPTTETVFNLQILNRYSYVGNNPLSLTDPSGLCFLGCFWKQSWFKAIFAIAVAIVLEQPWALAAWETSAFGASFGVIANAGIAGGIAGVISTGTLKGAALGALQGALFAGAGNILDNAGASGFAGIGHDASIFIAHGLVGGLVSEIGGGKFFSGFLAGGSALWGQSQQAKKILPKLPKGRLNTQCSEASGRCLGVGNSKTARLREDLPIYLMIGSTPS
jgi:RHS repeat-associated protein